MAQQPQYAGYPPPPGAGQMPMTGYPPVGGAPPQAQGIHIQASFLSY